MARIYVTRYSRNYSNVTGIKDNKGKFIAIKKLFTYTQMQIEKRRSLEEMDIRYSRTHVILYECTAGQYY
jgi:hypothetical protein